MDPMGGFGISTFAYCHDLMSSSQPFRDCAKSWRKRLYKTFFSTPSPLSYYHESLLLLLQNIAPRLGCVLLGAGSQKSNWQRPYVWRTLGHNLLLQKGPRVEKHGRLSCLFQNHPFKNSCVAVLFSKLPRGQGMPSPPGIKAHFSFIPPSSSPPHIFCISSK
jgi:hypothetical protein